MHADEAASSPTSGGHERLPLAPRSAADTTGTVSEMLSTFEGLGKANLIMRLLANSDTAFEPFVHFGGRLLRGAHLPRQVQEVVILHVAARRGSRYVVLQHLDVARTSGVSEPKLDAIIRDAGATDAAVFDHDELLAVAVADQVARAKGIDRQLWQRVVEAWGEAGGVDLILTAVHWGAMVPAIVDAFGLYDDDPD